MRHCAVVFILLAFLTSSSYSQDTVQVKVGWNIIGSVKAGAVPDVLSTKPDSNITTSFFGYAPGVGYESTDTLETGLGYWVKAKSDGLIVFNNAPPVDSCKSKAFIYEGKFYHTVKIGDQCWMAENLDVGVMIDSLANQTNNDTTEKYCYNNDPLNCALYGGLYQWNEAMQYVTTPSTQGICPMGWHVPSQAEYLTLWGRVVGDGNALKAVGQGGGVGAGTNTSGFSGLLAGYRSYYDGDFKFLGNDTYLGSSTGNDATTATTVYLNSFTSNISFNIYSLKYNGFSVRCLVD